MISTHYICNGCGLYTSYAGKNEKQLNEVCVNLSNYVILTSGFIMKEPEVKIHFCDPCMAKVIEGDARVKGLGDLQVMREKIDSLEKEKDKIKQEFDLYKCRVSTVLKGGGL